MLTSGNRDRAGEGDPPAASDLTQSSIMSIRPHSVVMRMSSSRSPLLGSVSSTFPMSGQ